MDEQPRSITLLKLAAEAMEDGRDPFNTSFLVEHVVTADEMFTLSDQVALGTRVLLLLNETIKKGGSKDKQGAIQLMMLAALSKEEK